MFGLFFTVFFRLQIYEGGYFLAICELCLDFAFLFNQLVSTNSFRIANLVIPWCYRKGHVTLQDYTLFLIMKETDSVSDREGLVEAFATLDSDTQQYLTTAQLNQVCGFLIGRRGAEGGGGVNCKEELFSSIS